MKIVVLAALLVLALAVGQAFADQIIFAPTGRTLGVGQAKLEAAVNADDSDQMYIWANVGIPRLELQAIRVQDQAGDHDDGFGAELSILPETLVTPAVGLGVRDVADSTSLGRAFYLAVTKTVPLVNRTGLPLRSLKLTGGVGVEDIDGFFGGVEMGFVHNIDAAAEFDGENFNASIGWKPIQPVQLKAYWLDGDFYYGGRLSIGL